MEVIPSVFATAEKEYSDRFAIAVSLGNRVHVDVMDGKFVKNKSPPLRVLKAKKSGKIEVHLMVEHPQEYIEDLKAIKASRVYLHIESHKTRDALLQNIFTFKAAGMQVGIALSPKTKIDSARDYLEEIDSILLMSVQPGKEGQKFLSSTLDKIDKLRKMTKKEIGVDGGIEKGMLDRLEKMGVGFAVAGSAIFS